MELKFSLICEVKAPVKKDEGVQMFVVDKFIGIMFWPVKLKENLS